ncbi:MAG: ribosome recycling factor [Chloroflexi bacterium]|nr:ribosome recycling factor [Chloroflexota bacterium]
MVTSLLSDAEVRMQKAVEAFKRDMNSIRTGRASPALLENLPIDYHGIPTPLKQLASISTPEVRLLVIQPWDRQAVSAIERGILKSGLGLNPITEGAVIRVPVPQPTEERRRELVKTLKRQGEEAHVAVRNIRRDVLEKVRAMERNKEMSQDDARRYQEQLQKRTDAFTDQIDSLAEVKEAEVMEV